MSKLRCAPSRLQRAPGKLQEITGSWRSGKDSSTARGYGYKWQQAREGFLRSHPLCVMCERLGLVTAASVVDHIVPHRGDQRLFWQPSNWQPLCKHCHDSVKARQESTEGPR